MTPLTSRLTKSSTTPLTSKNSKLWKYRWQPAFVVSWNGKLVRVLCPHCRDVETQSHDSDKVRYYGVKELELDLADTRVFNCRSYGVPYDVWFPFEGHPETVGLGWEKDIDSDGYITVGLNLPSLTDEPLPTRPNTVNRPSSQMLPFSSDELRDVYGNSELSLTARNGNVDGMRELLLQGANVDTVNLCGWTPLIHAAFWGQTNAVLLLLQHGASRNNVDDKGRTAFDLTKDCESLDRERRTSVHRYKEDVEKMKRERISIRKILRPIQVPIVSGQEYHKFQTTRNPTTISGRITLTASVVLADIQVNNQRATLGVLRRGSPYSDLVATSGWNGRAHGSPMLLNSSIWTRKVFELAELIQHKHRGNSRDQGIPGQFFASHAEKQLAAAFVAKHPLVAGTQHLRTATILIDRDPCRDCKTFCESLGKMFKVHFEFGTIERCEKANGIATPQTINSGVLKRKRVESFATGLLTPRDSGTDENLWGCVPEVSGKGRKRVVSEGEEDEGDPESPCFGRNVRARFRRTVAEG